MPRIFDNIDEKFLLRCKRHLTFRSGRDLCVGSFNLRGWKQLDLFIDKWSGEDDECCRLLRWNADASTSELRSSLSLVS